MHKGSCQCGSVNYQLNGEPLTCYTCHCTDCQTSSGSAFSISMIVNKADITVTKGEVAVGAHTLNGAEVKRHYCSQCGSIFWYSAETMAEFCVIKPGTFEDTRWFRPIANLWVRSAQPWVSMNPNIPTYETQPTIEELCGLWAKKENAE